MSSASYEDWLRAIRPSNYSDHSWHQQRSLFAISPMTCKYYYLIYLPVFSKHPPCFRINNRVPPDSSDSPTQSLLRASVKMKSIRDYPWEGDTRRRGGDKKYCFTLARERQLDHLICAQPRLSTLYLGMRKTTNIASV